jgi:hypothetical protein
MTSGTQYCGKKIVPSSPIGDGIERYRETAGECQSAAAQATYPDDKAAWLALARQWSDMADKLEDSRNRGI